MLHKLKLEHINLTSYFKMRVDLAAQVTLALYAYNYNNYNDYYTS